MKSLRYQIIAFALIASCQWGMSQSWQIKQAPVMTPWSSTIDTASVLPEYPRPQLVRKEWLNLNGIWQFQPGISASQTVPTGNLSSKILVPFPVESAISGIMVHYDRLWYKRHFSIPSNWDGKKTLLHFGAVDWECEVFINGKSIGKHSGGFDPFTFDITAYLVSGVQEIAVRVFDPTDANGQPRGKQVLNPEGIWYSPVTGIWQTVWLEPVAQMNISNLSITPDIDNQKILIKTNIENPPAGYTVQISILDGATTVASATGEPNAGIPIVISNPKLWSPNSPFLYDLMVYLKNGETVVDSVKSYFGMRKISIGKIQNFTKILLNNKFVFQMGPLDQGWWPDGLYTAPTDSALLWDIKKMKDLGFNMVRKHIKVEPARWYYWCDKMGLLVWQDMPSGNNITSTDRQYYEDDLRRMISALGNVPSIVMWIVFNEGWGQYDTERITSLAESYDNSRLVSNASGWVDKFAGDILDSHSYPAPSCLSSPDRAVVNGEFGGVALAYQGHMWNPNSWGYETVSSSKALEDKLSGFLHQIENFIPEGLSASVYTQLTDVELEINGLITYDRKISKVSELTISEMIKGLIAQGDSNFVIKPILLTSENKTQKWQYTFTNPPQDWNTSDFDDSGWQTGPGGFGTVGTPGAYVYTNWNSSDIWLRSTFKPLNLSPANLKNLLLRIHHDETAEIYINDKLACTFDGYSTKYFFSAINANALATIRTNEVNHLAIHCHQTAGGQYIDAGLYLKTQEHDTLTYSLLTPVKALEEKSWKVYPNPGSNGNFTLSFSDEDRYDTINILTINSMGNIVSQIRIQKSENIVQLSMPNLSPGFYFLQIRNETKNKATQKKIIIL